MKDLIRRSDLDATANSEGERDRVTGSVIRVRGQVRLGLKTYYESDKRRRRGYFSGIERRQRDDGRRGRPDRPQGCLVVRGASARDEKRSVA